MSTSYTPGSGSDGRKEDGSGAGDRRDSSPGGDGRGGDADGRADGQPVREDPRTRVNETSPNELKADETPTRVHEPVREEPRKSSHADSDRHQLDPDRDRDDPGAAGGAVIDRKSNVAREKEAYGGIKVGSAFFGWLTATGTAVLLTALVAAIAAAVGMSMNVNPDEATQNPQALQLTGAILLAVVLFVAYFAGGYVAGRMARFDGAKQGVAVWLWAVVVAIIVAVVTAIAGSQFNILANINSFPRLPVDEGAMTTTGIIALVIAAAVTLIGAILGGMTGMRYHRKVDRAGFDLENDPGALRR